MQNLYNKKDDQYQFICSNPTAITVKKDKSVKIALHLRKLNEITVKRKAQMPNMEELISK